MKASMIQAEITIMEQQLANINVAITQLALNPHKTFNLNTGQSTQAVGREDLERLREFKNGLMSDICVLQSRLTGAGITRVRPCW